MKFFLFKVTSTTTTTTTTRPTTTTSSTTTTTTTTTPSTTRPITTFSGSLSKLNLLSNYFERILSEISNSVAIWNMVGPRIIMGPFFRKTHFNKKDLTF